MYLKKIIIHQFQSKCQCTNEFINSYRSTKYLGVILILILPGELYKRSLSKDFKITVGVIPKVRCLVNSDILVMICY